MATLKNLVDETTNIKNELVICHAELLKNINNLGINALNNDKILTLINKLENINPSKKVVASENVLSGMVKEGSGITVRGKEYVVVGRFYIGLNGSIRVSTSLSSQNSNVTGYMVFNLIRNGSIQYSSNQFTTKAEKVYCSYDFGDVENGDIIEISVKTSHTSYYAEVYGMAIRGDVY